jgi:hypothetical protein
MLILKYALSDGEQIVFPIFDLLYNHGSKFAVMLNFFFKFIDNALIIILEQRFLPYIKVTTHVRKDFRQISLVLSVLIILW